MPNDSGTRRDDDRQAVSDCFTQIRASISVTPGGDPHTTVEEEPGRTPEPWKETVVGGVSPDRFARRGQVPSPCPGPLTFRLATLASTPGGHLPVHSAPNQNLQDMRKTYLITLERLTG
jgi:hypothetical protein